MRACYTISSPDVVAAIAELCKRELDGSSDYSWDTCVRDALLLNSPDVLVAVAELCKRELDGSIDYSWDTCVRDTLLLNSPDVLVAVAELHKRELDEDIEDHVPGDFKRVLVGLAQGRRSEEQVVDQQKVDVDVQQLYKVSLQEKKTTCCLVLVSVCLALI